MWLWRIVLSSCASPSAARSVSVNVWLGKGFVSTQRSPLIHSPSPPVKNTTGIDGRRARTSRANSVPFMAGMAKSTSRRWNSRPLSTRRSAASPLSAKATEKPLAASMAAIVSRHSTSSSTTRIVRFKATAPRRGSAPIDALRSGAAIDVRLSQLRAGTAR